MLRLILIDCSIWSDLVIFLREVSSVYATPCHFKVRQRDSGAVTKTKSSLNQYTRNIHLEAFLRPENLFFTENTGSINYSTSRDCTLCLDWFMHGYFINTDSFIWIGCVCYHTNSYVCFRTTHRLLPCSHNSWSDRKLTKLGKVFHSEKVRKQDEKWNSVPIHIFRLWNVFFFYKWRSAISFFLSVAFICLINSR